MNSVKRYDGNCFWKDGLENVPSLSLFENIKNEMTDWDVKLEYISFDEIQITSKDAPAQYVLVDNERGYVLNGEVILANQVKVYKYTLDYISTFFLPFIQNLQTTPLYCSVLRAPFFEPNNVVQCDDEKIRQIEKIGTYNYCKTYYYKENTTYNGQNVVRYYDNYEKASAENYIEYQSNDNVVNGCIYFVFADGQNSAYRFVPVLGKTGKVTYSKANSTSTNEPEHKYNVTINGTNPLVIMPNYQDFINSGVYASNRGCKVYNYKKSFNFINVSLTNGTNSNSKFPSTLSGTKLQNLLSEYEGIAYLSFPDYNGEDSNSTSYLRVSNGNSTYKYYLDSKTINQSTINVYWSMVQNTNSDNHYMNPLIGINGDIWNRLMLKQNSTYQTFAEGINVQGYSNSGGACDFSIKNSNNSYYLWTSNSYSTSINFANLPLAISTQNNIAGVGYNKQNGSLTYKYILTTPYKFEVNLKEYNNSSINTYTHNYNFYSGNYFWGNGDKYYPKFPVCPTYYHAWNATSYNSTTANYANFGNGYFIPRYGNTNVGVTINGDAICYGNAPLNSSDNFFFQHYIKTQPQDFNSTTLKITFPSKNSYTDTRYDIDNSWDTLYNYATSYYSNQSSGVSQFVGIFMLPHLFTFKNAVKNIQTRGNYKFLEVNLPPEGTDIKTFKFFADNYWFSKATPSKILHPNDSSIMNSWWYFSKYSDAYYMNNEIHPDYYYLQYNQMKTDGWFCFNGNGTYIDKLDVLSLKACIWTLPNQLPSYTNSYAQYVQNTINSANTSYAVAKNNMLAGIAGGVMNIAASAAMGAFSIGMGNVLAGALGDIGGVVGGIGRTAENGAMAGGASPLTNFVTGNKIKLSRMMGASQMTSGAMKNSGGLFSSIIGFKNRQMEIKAHYADAKNKMQNKLNPSNSDDIALLEQWVGETAHYNVIEYFWPSATTYKLWNSVIYYYSFKTLKNEYSNILFNENRWTMFDDCVYFVFDDDVMKSRIQSYKPFNDMYSNVKQYVYELLTNGFRIWRKKPEDCEK